MFPPRFVLWMRIEREEVPFCDIWFQSRTQRHQAFDKWAGRVLALHGVKKLLNRVGVLNAIYYIRSIIVEKNPADLEFLISRWSTETYIFVAACGKFSSLSEDVPVLMSLPIFSEALIIGLLWRERTRRRLTSRPNPYRVLSMRTTRKPTYRALKYFDEGDGRTTHSYSRLF